MLLFKIAEASKCSKYDTNVYVAEEMSAIEQKWHKICFKCGTLVSWLVS